MIFAAASMSLAFRSFIFFSGDLFELGLSDLPDLLPMGLTGALLRIEIACLISTAAGGLLVTNVNERSS